MARRLVLAPLLFLAATPVAAQELIKNIRVGLPTPVDSNPRDLSEFGGKLWFRAATESRGEELYFTDGTVAGTELLSDLAPGPHSSATGERAVLGNLLLFAADTPGTGLELWRTDGTAAGTSLVRDLHSLSASSNPTQLTPFNGAVYFAGTVGPQNGGRQLFRSNGTAPGTFLVTTALAHGDPKELTVAGGRLFFTAWSSDLGRQLYVTDGTPAGTERLTTQLNQPWPPNQLTELNGNVLFTVTPQGQGGQVWVSDGTVAGTQVVLTGFGPGFGHNRTSFLRVGSEVFFTPEGIGGSGVWRTDGTSAGTVEVFSNPLGSSLFTAGGLVYFIDGISALWRTDGTPGGTIELGFMAGLPEGVEYQGSFYFVGSAGRAIWRSDGTVEGTRSIIDLHLTGDFRPRELYSDGTHLWFSGTDGLYGQELYRSDGTAAGSVRVANLGAESGASSSPRSLLATGGRALFEAAAAGQGRELWSSDGTEEGTVLLRDILAGSGSSSLGRATAFRGGVVFTASATTSPVASRLWFTDGTQGGTFRVHARPSDPRGLVAHAGRLWCSGNGSNDAELWAWDGVNEPYEVMDIRPPFTGSSPREIVGLGNGIVFSADDGDVGREPWYSDGTESGTQRLRDIAPQEASSNPRSILSLGDLAVFVADGPEGAEPWVTDGTPAGTRILMDVEPGAPGSDPELPILFENEVYLRVAGTNAGVWKTDGTPEGTALVTDLTVDEWVVLGDSLVAFADGAHVWSSDGTGLGTQVILPLDSEDEPRNVTVAGDRVYFSLQSQLWITDGSAAGTELLAEIDPLGLLSSVPESGIGPISPSGSGREVLFGADNGSGSELWLSDGTAAGTALLADLFPGVGGSKPDEFLRAGSRIFFAADDGLFGRELYAVDVAQTGAFVAEVYGAGCPASGTGVAADIRVTGEPRLGQSFLLGVTRAPVDAFALLLVSNSAAFTPLGDCIWYLGPGAQGAGLIDTGPQGEADRLIPVPGDAALLGTPMFCQFGITDPGGPIQGSFTVSSAMEILPGP